MASMIAVEGGVRRCRDRNPISSPSRRAAIAIALSAA
jgi:hypothetical protein